MNKIFTLIKNRKLIRQIKHHIEFKKALKFKGTDEEYLISLGKVMLGYEMNLQNPITFNEKLNWYKLNYKNELMPICADKIKVDEYVKSKGLSSILIKKYHIWNSVEEIDISTLPNKFVLKTNNDSGGVVICNNKKSFNIKKAKAKLKKSYDRNYETYAKEWPYGLIDKKVFAEEFIEPNSAHGLLDYKFFCFNGKPQIIMICSDRQSNLKIDFFDLNGNKINTKRYYPNSELQKLVITQTLKQMINVAKILSNDFPFARVDLYNDNGKIYFGEITFFPGAGMEPFDCIENDKIFGDYFDISNI